MTALYAADLFSFPKIAIGSAAQCLTLQPESHGADKVQRSLLQTFLYSNTSLLDQLAEGLGPLMHLQFLYPDRKEKLQAAKGTNELVVRLAS